MAQDFIVPNAKDSESASSQVTIHHAIPSHVSLQFLQPERPISTKGIFEKLAIVAAVPKRTIAEDYEISPANLEIGIAEDISWV